MPKHGFKAVTLPTTLHSQLLQLAGQQNKTVPEVVAELLNLRVQYGTVPIAQNERISPNGANSWCGRRDSNPGSRLIPHGWEAGVIDQAARQSSLEGRHWTTAAEVGRESFGF